MSRKISKAVLHVRCVTLFLFQKTLFLFQKFHSIFEKGGFENLLSIMILNHSIYDLRCSLKAGLNHVNRPLCLCTEGHPTSCFGCIMYLPIRNALACYTCLAGVCDLLLSR